jgi:hypothetical protein
VSKFVWDAKFNNSEYAVFILVFGSSIFDQTNVTQTQNFEIQDPNGTSSTIQVLTKNE